MKAVENRERIKAGAGPKPVPQRAADDTPVPSESVEQQRLFLWARMQSGKYYTDVSHSERRKAQPGNRRTASGGGIESGGA